MNTISKDTFVASLLAKGEGYTATRAEKLFVYFEAADSDIQEATVRWLKDGTKPIRPPVEGWDTARMEEHFGMNSLAALLTLDWLRKEPAKALCAIKEGIK